MGKIRDVILTQKRELDLFRKEKYIHREILIGKDEFNSDLIKVIIGPRRAGKSFYAIHQLLDFKAAYLNFDDERLLKTANLDEIIVTLESVYGKFNYVFFDEIQNLPDWELFVNRLKRSGFNIILTGSNSNLLSQELSTHLTGRFFQYVIFPFSFKEYIDFFGKVSTFTTAEIKEKLHNYIINGGYPEIITKKIQNTKYLKTLTDSVIYKDIVLRYNIKDGKMIDNLFQFLVSNPGLLTSYNKLKNNLNFNSVNTIKNYVEYLENAFLIFHIDKFSYKIKEQINSNKKFYLIDNGFYNAKGFKYSKNLGNLYENAVAVELKKKSLINNIEFYYYHNTQKYETDFVISENGKVSQLIQVCYNIENQPTREREIRGLIHASNDLNCNELVILNSEFEKTEEIEWYNKTYQIKFIPFHKWFLSN